MVLGTPPAGAGPDCTPGLLHASEMTMTVIIAAQIKISFGFIVAFPLLPYSLFNDAQSADPEVGARQQF